MANGERSGTGGRSDRLVRLATGVGTATGSAVALLWRPDVGGFWPGMLAFLLVCGAGGLLGGLLFRPSSDEAQEHPPRD